MTNIIKTRPAVLTNAVLIAGMKAVGIVPSVNSKGGVIFTSCPVCAEFVLSRNPEYTKDTIKGAPWYQSSPAIVFKKANGSTLKACRCGYRELVVKVQKPMCPICNIVTLKAVGDRCLKCHPLTPQEKAVIEAERKAATEAPVKQCNRKHCTNPVPDGRKAVCYECQPPSSKEYHVEM